MMIGAGAIAGDFQTGAFTFYFARSVRPRDYVLGKIVAVTTLVGAIALGGPLFLALFRLGLCDSLDEVIQRLAILPRIVLVGTLATLAFGTVPLAFSSLASNRRTALALWAAYYVVVGRLAWEIGTLSGGKFAMVDLLAASRTLAYGLFDVEVARTWGSKWGQPIGAAFASLAIHATAAIAIVWWRVTHAQRSGVGGSS
jgi:hypothetical protein